MTRNRKEFVLHAFEHLVHPLRAGSAIVNRWFLMIAEPRVQRILWFIVYVALVFVGAGVIASPPPKFEGVLGLTLVYVFGSFVAFGGLLALVAVLPGIWWLERVGILSLLTGLGIYLVIIVALGITLVGFAFFAMLLILFTIRWMDIRLYQLAPLKPAAIGG